MLHFFISMAVDFPWKDLPIITSKIDFVKEGTCQTYKVCRAA
ncbi:MAG: hypothetical protein QM763_19955 [Agriterribacter sp.]